MKIMVPLDGSLFSEAALPAAASFAARDGIDVVLVTVLDPGEARATYARPPGGAADYMRGIVEPTGRVAYSLPTRLRADPAETGSQASERAKTEAEEGLKDASKKFFSGKAQTMVLLGGDPGKTLVKYAKESGVDVIAMATPGRSGIPRAVLGSVASKLLEAGVAPVLLVRPDSLSPSSMP